MFKLWMHTFSCHLKMEIEMLICDFWYLMQTIHFSLGRSINPNFEKFFKVFADYFSEFKHIKTGGSSSSVLPGTFNCCRPA